MQLGANHPMARSRSPTTSASTIVCAMAENLHASFHKDYMAPPETLKKLVKAGKLGQDANGILRLLEAPRGAESGCWRASRANYYFSVIGGVPAGAYSVVRDRIVLGDVMTRATFRLQC
jgi:3-hydroxyacyl-CoA dehydrogenase